MSTNLKENVAWSLAKASIEFGVSREKLRSRLADARESASADGTYSTKQITGALFGDAHRARLGKVEAERKLVELQLKKELRQVLPAAAVEKAWAFLLQGVRSRWLQTPSKAAMTFPTWVSARDAEAWQAAEVESILADLAENPDYSLPDEEDDDGDN